MRYLCQLANITDMDSAIMVGDRKFDVSGAHAIGMECVGVLYGYGSEAELSVRCGGRRNRAAGESEGARLASGAINRGNAEATPQASACGVVAVCGMLDAAGSPAAQMKCYIIRSARSGYRKNRPASYRTCGAVLCNVRFRLRAALTSSAT